MLAQLFSKKTAIINPWTIEQRALIAKAMNSALDMKLTAENIIGAMTDNGDVHIIWLGDGKRQSFMFAIADFRRMLDEVRMQEVSEAFTSRNMKVVGVYTNNKSDKCDQVFVIRDRRDTFLGVVGMNKDGRWFVTRVSGNGRPIYVNNLNDAALSLWMLECGAIAV